MKTYQFENEVTTHSVKETENNRLSKDTKLVKCSLCDTTNTLTPFKNSYICRDCIDFTKDI